MMKRMAMIILILAYFLTLTAPPDKRLVIIKSNPVEYFTMEDVHYLLVKYNVKYLRIVKAQVRLETGDLKSRICRENKNLFGMRYAPYRGTTAIGEQYYSAVYPSYEASIQDYQTWQSKYFLRGGSYYDFLQRIGYAEDPDYIKKLKILVKKL